MFDRLFARLYLKLHYSPSMINHVAQYGLDPYEKKRFTQNQIVQIELICHEKSRTQRNR